jgi:uncharacterized protein
MTTMPSVLARYAGDLREALGPDLDHVVLFGSRAMGTHRPDSDYDVAVFVRDEANLARSRQIASDVAYPYVLSGYDIRPVVLHRRRRDERSQFLGHVREVGIPL